MIGVIPDGLQMDSQTHIPVGVRKTADLAMQVQTLNLEPVAGIEPAILPFTRRRCVVRLRVALILAVSPFAPSATFPQVAP